MALVRGQLGALDNTGDATLRDIYTVPASKVADVNVTIANRADTITNIRLAHIKAGVASGVADKDYLIYDLPTSSLASNLAPLSVTGIIMSAADTIAVYSSASDVTVQVNGIEEDVS